MEIGDYEFPMERDVLHDFLKHFHNQYIQSLYSLSKPLWFESMKIAIWI